MSNGNRLVQANAMVRLETAKDLQTTLGRAIAVADFEKAEAREADPGWFRWCDVTRRSGE